MNASTSHRRWWIWFPLLCIAAWLALFGDKIPSHEQVVTTVPPMASLANRPRASIPERPNASIAQAAGKAAVLTALEPLIPRQQLYPQGASKTSSKDLFASGSWTAPPKPVTPSPFMPPPLPSAPPLPFAFIGKKLEGTTWEVYVTRGEQSFVLRQGSVIDNTYRIHAVTPPSMNLIYLPLGQTQTLAIGESQ